MLRLNSGISNQDDTHSGRPYGAFSAVSRPSTIAPTIAPTAIKTRPVLAGWGILESLRGEPQASTIAPTAIKTRPGISGVGDTPNRLEANLRPLARSIDSLPHREKLEPEACA